MIETKLSISDSISSGFEMWKRHFRKIIIVGLIVYVPVQIGIEIASVLLEKFLIMDSLESLRIANHVYNLIRFLLGSVALLGILNFIISELEDENKQEPTVKEILLSGLNKWGTFIGVVFIAGFKILGYTLLLIIPGIHKAVKLSFIDCIVATNNNKFKDECDESEMLVNNNWWKVFGFLLIINVLQILLEFLFIIPLYYSESLLFSISLGVLVSLLETYFIVVRANYFFKIKQLKNESKKLKENPIEIMAIDKPTV